MSLLDQLKAQAENSVASSFKSNNDAQGITDIVKSVSIPIKVRYDGGDLRMYLEVPVEILANMNTLYAALDEINKKYDLAIFRYSNNNNERGGDFKQNRYNNSRYNNNNNYRNRY